MADHGIAVARIDCPGPEWADLHTADRGKERQVRIALTGRDEPIEFPGMYLRELFTEGRHTRHTVAGSAQRTPLIDLRAVL